jgi:hypothetical protein
MKVKFTEGPSALVLPDGTVVERDESVEVNPELGKQLVDQDWTDVDGVLGEPEALSKLKRGDLEARAAELGVESPDKLANKQEVIDAIEAAESEKETK